MNTAKLLKITINSNAENVWQTYFFHGADQPRFDSIYGRRFVATHTHVLCRYIYTDIYI